MKKNLKIGFVMVFVVIISISCVAFGYSLLSNDKGQEMERDVLLSLEEYEKEYDKEKIIFKFTESLTPENFFGDNKLIVRGKLKSIRGVAFTVGEAPCIVYELEVADTIINNSGKEHKIINLAIPEMMISDVKNKLQLDRELIFYLEYFDETFPHLKEDYYGLISPTRGIEICDGDEDSYKQLKKNLLERERKTLIIKRTNNKSKKASSSRKKNGKREEGAFYVSMHSYNEVCHVILKLCHDT